MPIRLFTFGIDQRQAVDSQREQNMTKLVECLKGSLAEEEKMKCAICRHGITTAGYTTVVLERGQTTVVFKKVPAQICDNCGEEYISESVNKALLRQAHEQWERGIILEMLNFAA